MRSARLGLDPAGNSAFSRLLPGGPAARSRGAQDEEVPPFAAVPLPVFDSKGHHLSKHGDDAAPRFRVSSRGPGRGVKPRQADSVWPWAECAARTELRWREDREIHFTSAAAPEMRPWTGSVIHRFPAAFGPKDSLFTLLGRTFRARPWRVAESGQPHTPHGTRRRRAGVRRVGSPGLRDG